ncbi:MAG TPA: choice-of-anchor V domain-containing protein [Candidatus Thalassarchaeaceae archaeon]|nr:choice-of-anchor V domain-containing protein [Candidatus Thalassarchaeaceae archaeon]HJO42497.1 choice-of-anchor V domain-containing protein [Candidatus Thalassarchaeaceae archaeon]
MSFSCAVPFGGYLSRKIVVLLSCILLLTPTILALPGGISGAVVDSGCMCHGGASEEVLISVDGLPETFVVEEVYTVTVSFEGGPDEAGENYGGFNLKSTHGTLYEIDNSVQIIDNEATHTEEGNNQRSWTIEWKAPSNDGVSANFVLLVNSVDGDGTSSGDQWNELEFTTMGENVGASGGGLAWTGADNVPVWKTFLIGLAISMVIIYVLPKEGEQENSSGEE